MTEKHIDLLWLRMAKIYGHKWTSSYGESDDGTWLAGLYDVTIDQVRYGLERLRVDGERIWPPTLPEFRLLCLPERVPAYHKDYIALPRPAQDPDATEKALAAMRRALGTANPPTGSGSEQTEAPRASGEVVEVPT